VSLDLEAQYDKIYRYCYHKLHQRELAEDITQETFLRYFASDSCHGTEQTLRFLYTIARNLCVDEYRRHPTQPLEETYAVDHEEDTLTSLALRGALAALTEEERELVLLRYVNEVPVGVLCKLYDSSRFALYRRTQAVLKKLKESLGEEAFT
jgi:RNA polymerase sigma-70 factor (ECF subfamily)